MALEQYTGGGVAPMGQVPSGAGVAPSKPSIWSDPNLMAIMLGMGAQAVMGRHQQTWQAQLGKGATQLGQSFKMADIAAKKEAERKEERDYWKKLVEGIQDYVSPARQKTMSLGNMLGVPY